MKAAKIAGIVLGVVVVVIAAGIGYLYQAFPKVPPAADIAVAGTPEQIARGAYLANHVTICIDCHSTREFDYYSGPADLSTAGKGGQIFSEEMGFPGSIPASNITPVKLSSWTDGEIMRAVTSGVSKDGTPLFPIMPYPEYNALSEPDVNSLVAYLRTLAPLENEPPARHLNFPLNLIVRLMPMPYVAKAHPDTSNKLEYGKYLSTIAGCKFCHTPMVEGQPVPEMAFAGGQEFPMPGFGVSTSMNITPDADTGVGGWDLQTFIEIFRSYSPEEVRSAPLGPDDPRTDMPWSMYSGMTDSDLEAIYTFLMSLEPIASSHDRWTPEKVMDETVDQTLKE